MDTYLSKTLWNAIDFVNKNLKSKKKLKKILSKLWVNSENINDEKDEADEKSMKSSSS